MKKITLITLITLSGVAIGTTKVSAAPGDKGEVVAGNPDKKATTTTVKIKDSDDGDDKFDPKDPNQTDLFIVSVPGSFDFSTKMSHNSYSIQSGEVTGDSKEITVFNNRIDRDWAVKATLVDDKIYLGDSENKKGFEVSEFMVNGVNVTATGQPAVVAKAVAKADRTAENNTKMISTAVNSLGIKFTDADNTLKIGDNLKGQINYTLYNTIEAK